MKRVYPFRAAVGPSSTVTSWMTFANGIPYDTPTDERNVAIPWSVSGTFSYMKIAVNAAPGAGKSWTWTVRVNGVDTAMAVTISDTNTSGEWTGSVSINAGDWTAMRIVPSGTPAGHVTQWMTLEFEPTTAKMSHFAVHNPSLNGTFMHRHGALGTSYSTASFVKAANIVPMSGTITGAYAITGYGASFAVGQNSYIELNGVAQDGGGGTPDTRIALSAGGGAIASGSATFSLPVVPGDLITVVASGTSGVTRQWGWSMAFSGVEDKMPMAFQGGTASTSSVEWADFLTGESNSTFNGTTPPASSSYSMLGPTTIRLSDMYWTLETAPGASKTRKLELYSGSGAPQNLNITLSGTTASGSDLSNSDVFAYSEYEGILSVEHTPSGTPTIPAGDFFRMSLVQEADLGLDAVRLADGVIRTDAVTSIDADGFTAGTEQSQSGVSHWWQAFTAGSIGDASNQASGGIFEADVDAIYTDAGDSYESRVRTKQFVLGGILRRFGIMAAGTLVTPSSGETLSLKLIRDYERETLTKTIDLTPTGTESGSTYVLRQLDDSSMSDLLSFQAEITDSSGTFGWSCNQMIFKLTDLEGQ